MKYEVVTNSGMGNFSFEANSEQELKEKLARAEKVIKSNRFWYKFVNQVFDENGNYICQW
jgi:hypothetical protein